MGALLEQCTSDGPCRDYIPPPPIQQREHWRARCQFYNPWMALNNSYSSSAQLYDTYERHLKERPGPVISVRYCWVGFDQSTGKMLPGQRTV